MSPRSTAEVAKLVGIHLRTLERWIEEEKVKPKRIRVGRKTYRLWTVREVEKVRRVKKETYWKGRGRKRKAKK